jgi:hypothetical protein
MFLSRVSFTVMSELGIFASDSGTHLDAEDVALVAIDSRSDNGAAGRGLSMAAGATATLRRVSIDGAREIGIMVHGPGSAIDAEDLVVQNVRVERCAESGCESQVGAIGGFSGARFSASRFLVESGDLCGVWLQDGAEMDLSSGEVRGHTIGACILVPDYDIDRLTDDVAYADNETNLESPALVVPVPRNPLSSSQ